MKARSRSRSAGRTSRPRIKTRRLKKKPRPALARIWSHGESAFAWSPLRLLRWTQCVRLGQETGLISVQVLFFWGFQYRKAILWVYLGAVCNYLTFRFTTYVPQLLAPAIESSNCALRANRTLVDSYPSIQSISSHLLLEKFCDEYCHCNHKFPQDAKNQVDTAVHPWCCT